MVKEAHFGLKCVIGTNASGVTGLTEFEVLVFKPLGAHIALHRQRPITRTGKACCRPVTEALNPVGTGLADVHAANANGGKVRMQDVRAMASRVHPGAHHPFRIRLHHCDVLPHRPLPRREGSPAISAVGAFVAEIVADLHRPLHCGFEKIAIHSERAEALFGALGINEVEHFISLPVLPLDIHDKSASRHRDIALGLKSNQAVVIQHRGVRPCPYCRLRNPLGQSLPRSNPESNSQRQRAGKRQRPRYFPSQTNIRHETIPFLDSMSTLLSDREHSTVKDKSQGQIIPITCTKCFKANPFSIRTAMVFDVHFSAVTNTL